MRHLAPAAASLLVALPLAFAGTDAHPRDPLCVDLPDGWSRQWKTAAHSRTWRFSPSAIDDATFATTVFDVDVLLTVQLDQPKRELADLAPRDLAERIFATKVDQYGAAGIPIGHGEVAAATVAGVAGFQTLFDKRDGDVERTFVAPASPFIVLVTLSYNEDRDGAHLPAAESLWRSLDLDRGGTLAETRTFSDSSGSFGLPLPSDWVSRVIDEGSYHRFLATPEPTTGDSFVVGFELMIWADYSKHAPRELSGSDEKVRDGWVATALYVVDEGTRAVPMTPVPMVKNGIEGYRVEVSRVPSSGGARHRLHFIGALDDVLIDATFSAPEIEWPRYATTFERALDRLELHVGRGAVSPILPNEHTGRYGDALLLADVIDDALSEGWILVRAPAPGSSAGWQSDDERRRILLKVEGAASAKGFADDWRKQLPGGTDADELFRRNGRGAEEVGFAIHLPNGREVFMHMAALDAGDGRIFWLNATLDSTDDEARREFDEIVATAAKRAPTLARDDRGVVRFTLPAKLEAHFTPPKDWNEGRSRCRSVVSFDGDGSSVELRVQPIESHASYVWDGVEREDRMNVLGFGEPATLAERRLPGGESGENRELTSLRTTAAGERVWTRAQTLHRAGHAATLTVTIPLAEKEKPIAAERRARPIFTSFKVGAAKVR